MKMNNFSYSFLPFVRGVYSAPNYNTDINPAGNPIPNSGQTGDFTDIINRLAKLEGNGNTPIQNPLPAKTTEPAKPIIDEGAEAVKQQAKLEKDFKIEKQSKMKSRILKRRYSKMDGEIKVYFDTNVANLKGKTPREQYKELKTIAFNAEKQYGAHKELATKSKNYKSFLKAEKEHIKKQNEIAKLNTQPTLNGGKNGKFKNNIALNDFLNGKKILA